MASITPPSDNANGTVGKPASKDADKSKPAAVPDVIVVDEEEEEDEEEDEYEEVDDEEEKQTLGDDEDEDDQEEEGDNQGEQDKSQSLTHFLLDNPDGQLEDNDEEEEEEAEDVYIPPAPEPISRKRSHKEVAEPDEEPDSKKAKA